VIKRCLSADCVQSDNTVYLLLPLRNVTFPIQYDCLNATYDEYVLFQNSGNYSVLRVSFENHDAVFM
jgi:hypothetical protein